MIFSQQGGISTGASFERMHYLERWCMLSDLHRYRSWFSEWYYWLRFTSSARA